MKVVRPVPLAPTTISVKETWPGKYCASKSGINAAYTLLCIFPAPCSTVVHPEYSKSPLPWASEVLFAEVLLELDRTALQDVDRGTTRKCSLAKHIHALHTWRKVVNTSKIQQTPQLSCISTPGQINRFTNGQFTIA